MSTKTSKLIRPWFWILKREKDHPPLSHHLLKSLVEKEKYNYTVHTRFQKKKSLLTVNLWASLVAQLVKNPPAKRETWVWSLGWEDDLEKGKALLQYSGLENYMDYTVCGVTKSRTRLSNFHFINILNCKIHVYAQQITSFLCRNHHNSLVQYEGSPFCHWAIWAGFTLWAGCMSETCTCCKGAVRVVAEGRRPVECFCVRWCGHLQAVCIPVGQSGSSLHFGGTLL